MRLRKWVGLLQKPLRYNKRYTTEWNADDEGWNADKTDATQRG